MEWNQQVYYPLQGKTIFNYFALLSVAFHDIYSVFGFFVFLTVINQLISGTMLSFSLVLEPMIVPMVREEEDVEDLYIDDFFLTSWERSWFIIYFLVFSFIQKTLFKCLWIRARSSLKKWSVHFFNFSRSCLFWVSIMLYSLKWNYTYYCCKYFTYFFWL